MSLPDAAELTAALRALPPEDRDAYLDRYRPDIDAAATTAEIAGWLRMSPASIRTEQFRPRMHGPKWPEPARFGRTLAWSPRAIALYRASQPGPGNRTPRRSERTV